MLHFLINWIGFNKIIARPKLRLLNSTLLNYKSFFLSKSISILIQFSTGYRIKRTLFGHTFLKLIGCKNQGELIPRTTTAQEILRIIPNSFIKVSLLSESVHEPLFFKHRHSQEDLVKFMFSTKATKIDEIFTFNLTLIR